MRKHIAAAAAALALLATAGAAQAADTVKRGSIACITESLLDEALRYAIAKDMTSLGPLLVSGKCAVLKVGEPVSVIEAGFMTAQLRYKGVKVYAPAEVVR